LKAVIIIYLQFTLSVHIYQNAMWLIKDNPPNKTHLPRENVFIHPRLRNTSPEKIYFANYFICLLQRTCQIPSAFTKECHSTFRQCLQLPNNCTCLLLVSQAWQTNSFGGYETLISGNIHGLAT